MAKFRKKPVVVDAFQWFPSMNRSAMPDWALAAILPIEGQDPSKLVVHVKDHGAVAASAGDWIIRGTAGEVYPCTGEIFRAVYEAMDGGTDS